MHEETDEIEYIIEPGKRVLSLKELWQYRELFYFFTWRDVKVKYKQTVLGILWVVLQPVLAVVVFSFFFGVALKVPASGLDYPVFAFSGLLLWNVFASGINSAGNSMISQAQIIKKIYFPRVIIPISATLVSVLDFLISFVVFIILLFYYRTHVNIPMMLVCWPVAVLLMLISTMGISCWLAALSVKYRDFKYVIPFGLQILLFMTPILYPASVVQYSWAHYVLAINPMYGAINFFRMPLIGYTQESVLLGISVLAALLFFVIGIYYFKRTEAFFADIA